MTRCWLMLLCTCLSFSAEAKSWAFDVYMDDRKIGEHTFKLEQNKLISKADFKVKLLFITAYEYHHQADEVWNGNCIERLQATTEENGEMFSVSGQKQAQAFVVSDEIQTQNLPACSMTFAYWNPAILKQQQLLNPQNAEYLDVKISPIGDKDFMRLGQTISTVGYEILGSLDKEYKDKQTKLNIKVWYDQNQDWVALQSITPEGYLIDYRLQTP